MAIEFEKNFIDGDILNASHVNAIQNAIQDLEEELKDKSDDLSNRITNIQRQTNSNTTNINTIVKDTNLNTFKKVDDKLQNVEELETNIDLLKDQSPYETIMIPNFKDIDNSGYKNLIMECLETWTNALAKGYIHYVSLGELNEGDGRARAINPMLYLEFNKSNKFEDSIIRDIGGEYYLKEVNSNVTLDGNFKFASQGSLNCISLANMLMMGIPYEHSRLQGDKNIIGACGYGFDICKYLPRDINNKKTTNKIPTITHTIDGKTYKIADYRSTEIERKKPFITQDTKNKVQFVTYDPKQTLDASTFQWILTQDTAWGQKDKSNLGSWGRLGLAKHLKKSTKDLDDDSVTFGDIQPGDILVDDGHTTFVLDVIQGKDKDGNSNTNATQITYVDINNRNNERDDIQFIKFHIIKTTSNGETTYTPSENSISEADPNGTTRNFIKVMRPYYQKYNKIDTDKSDYMFQEQSSTEMPLNKTYNGRKVYSYRSSFNMEDIRTKIKDNEYKFELDLKAARVLTFQVLATNEKNVVYPFPFISISGDNMQVIAYARYNRNGTNGKNPDELSFSFISNTALENYEIRYYIEYTK